jgi:hypothetical protein
MMSIPGVTFESAWERREEVLIAGVPVLFISRADLIQAKKASGRPQDRIDVDLLEKAETVEPEDGGSPRRQKSEGPEETTSQ